MNVVFFGPPGAGKGTVASMVSEKTELPHVSTGDLFREAIRNETDLGRRVKTTIEAGDLVPDRLTIATLRERLKRSDANQGVLLDGFPRTVPQADALSEMIAIDKVLNLQSDEELIIRRLSGRRVCKACGHIHHIDFRPPRKANVCDRCGSELYQRRDDMVEAIKKRLGVYAKQTEPLITYYRDAGLLVDIDGNPKAETVCDSVLKTMGL